MRVKKIYCIIIVLQIILNCSTGNQSYSKIIPISDLQSPTISSYRDLGEIITEKSCTKKVLIIKSKFDFSFNFDFNFSNPFKGIFDTKIINIEFMLADSQNSNISVDPAFYKFIWEKPQIELIVYKGERQSDEVINGELNVCTTKRVQALEIIGLTSNSNTITLPTSVPIPTREEPKEIKKGKK